MQRMLAMSTNVIPTSTTPPVIVLMSSARTVGPRRRSEHHEDECATNESAADLSDDVAGEPSEGKMASSVKAMETAGLM